MTIFLVLSPIVKLALLATILYDIALDRAPVSRSFDIEWVYLYKKACLALLVGMVETRTCGIVRTGVGV